MESLLQQARDFEAQGQWDRASELYDAAFRLDRSLLHVKEKHQHCLRRYWQARRHRDISYRAEVLSLKYGDALVVYGMMLDTLLDNGLDRKKTDGGALFRKGVEELDAALSDRFFRDQYLIGVGEEQVGKFRAYLRRQLTNLKPMDRKQAITKLRDVAFAAQLAVKLSCTVTVMEFTCGAGYAFDEYSLYLTPNQLRELVDSVRGGQATAGLELRVVNSKLMVHNTANFSEAAARLNPGDEIISIDRKPARGLSLDEAAEMLAGQPGTTVELQVLSRGMELVTLNLRRDTVLRPSVSATMKSDSIGYLQITGFKDSTAHEVDNALSALVKAGMKGLVLDLRDNDGGLFESAVDVAGRFLPSGIIATTENADPSGNKVYEAKNPDAFQLPMVVLINGDTASAAEVLAGALKENKRARLVGETTFGKGCSQCFVKFPAAPGGIPTGGLRLTIARFYSPDGLPYAGRGVAPHIVIGRFGMDGSMMMGGADQQMDAALVEVQRLMEPGR